MAELTLEESIRQILPTLPLPIQKFFEQRKLDTVTRLLTERYALHLDQGTIIERELMFLLLGLKSPDEFAAELYEQLPVSKQTVKDIISDINQEVFVPLREEEMRKGGESAAQLVKPLMPRAATPASASQMQTGSSSGGTQPTSHFHLQNKIAPPMRSAASSPAAVTPAPSTVNIPSNKMLEDHEEPHIEFSKAPASSPAPVRAPIAPQIPPRPASIPNAGPASAFAKGSEPPANLPGAMPSGVIPPGGRPSFLVPPKMQTSAPELPKQAPAIAPQESAAPRTPMPPTPPAVPAPAAPKTPPPAPKSYSVDPYREPIE